MWLYNYLCVVIVCCTLLSCTGNLQEGVQYALQQAGENRGELSKILKYYQNQPEKLKAARFLIANMPAHRTYVGKEIDSLKQMKKESIQKGRISDEIVAHWKTFNYSSSQVVEDIDVIKADILIENIDLAFEAWEKRSWSKQYSFEDFCEYVLPYRIGDEPLEKWRRIYYERYSPVLDSLYQGNDVVEAARVMANYLKEEGFTNHTDFNLPHLGALFLFENRVGYCRDNCDIATYVMRSLGIPITMDFYEVSPSYNSRHFWSALIDTTGFVVPFNYIEQEIVRQSQNERKRGKVYRYYYGLQQEKYSGLYSDEEVPVFFRRPFMKDVSSEYFPESNIKLESSEAIDSHWGYLCVFTGAELQPIDISEFHGKKIEFANVEPELIYFPTFRKAGKMKAFSYPFLLKKDSIEYFIPDTTRKHCIVLTRKYPIGRNPMFLGTAVGVKIEGANRKDFRDAELLCQVVDTPKINYNILFPTVQKKFRYVRYSAPEEKQIQVGEWYMYGIDAETAIAPEKIWANHPLSDIHKKILNLLTDDDWSSFYMSAVKGEQLIFDLGIPQILSHFILIPRNDDNYIHLGDRYELFYHGGIKGWISLGKQIAEGTELYYEGVPDGALLWLHNHTRGKEERCFYMKDGKQLFI